MIAREIYLKTIRLLRDHNLIKVITGVRRCGKSTLLEAFRNELLESGVSPENIIFFNFEERENIKFHHWTALYGEILSTINFNQKNYVFGDEVEFDSLFVKKNIDLYITSSSAYLLSSELASLLTDSYITVNLHPFSFFEYTIAFPEEKNTDRLFRQFLNHSFFPEAVNLSKTAPELVNNYLQSIYDTVIGKDIVQQHKLENVVFLERLRRGGMVFAGKNKDKDKEVDFMVQKANNERAYYQVSFTANDEKTFEREFSSFRNIKDHYPKYLLTLDYDNRIIEGIQKKLDGLVIRKMNNKLPVTRNLAKK